MNGDGFMLEKVSLYLNDGINSSTVDDILFIVNENHPPLIKGRSEV